MFENISWNNPMLYFAIVVWFLCILTIVLAYLKNKIIKSIFSLKKNTVYEVDKVFYELAQYQEKNKWSNVNLDLIESLFKLENPTYIWNIDLILSKLKALQENALWDIASKSTIDTITKNAKKLRNKNIIKKIVDISIFVLMCVIIVISVLTFK